MTARIDDFHQPVLVDDIIQNVIVQDKISICRFADLQIWRFGDLEIWRFGDLEIWRFQISEPRVQSSDVNRVKHWCTEKSILIRFHELIQKSILQLYNFSKFSNRFAVCAHIH